MHNKTSSSTSPTTNEYDARVDAEAARIRAELGCDPAPTGTPAIEPVIVSCQVSTCREGDAGRGSYAVQLAVGETTVTTCVSLPDCCDVSLRMAAYKAALALIEGQLSLARASEHIACNSEFAPKKKRKSKQGTPEEPQVHRQSFWISKIHPGGDPDFESTAWNGTFSLGFSAAFAELAFHQID